MRTKTFAMVAAAALVLSLTTAGETDFHNCGVCQPMAAEPGLMQNVKWESHEIATGMLSVTTVSPDYEKAYERAHKKMMENVERMMSGEEMDLCPFCERTTALAKAGAHIQNLDAENAHIMVVTSDEPEVIEKIHAHLAWMEEVSKQQQQHAGHDHKG